MRVAANAFWNEKKFYEKQRCIVADWRRDDCGWVLFRTELTAAIVGTDARRGTTIGR